MIVLDLPHEMNEIQLEITAQVNPGGNVNVRGFAEFDDNGSTVKLIAENRGSSANCADAGEGDLELTDLTISLRAEKSSERIVAAIKPAAGVQIIGTGTYDAVLVFDGRISGDIDVKLFVEFDAHPGRGQVRQRGNET